jgi:type IV secretory pathway VirJ component
VNRFLLAGVFGLAAPGLPSQARPQPLPTVTVAPAGGDGSAPLVLLLTGDGDWGRFPKILADTLAAHGAPVLGVKMRSYLKTPRTPDEASADIGAAVQSALTEWHRSDLMVVGYSRGAALAPFIVSRWPGALRARVRRIVFVGLIDHAGFHFHTMDLIRDVHRPTDLPVPPEIEKIREIPMVCLVGESEQHSFCSRAPPGRFTVVVHPGGHVVHDEADTVPEVLRALDLEAPVATPSRRPDPGPPVG